MSTRNTDRVLFGLNEDNASCWFTPFSLVHALSGWYMGVVFNYIGLNNVQSFIAVNGLHFIYELKDYYIMYYTDKGKPGTSFNNTLINSIGDQISVIIGVLIFYYVQKGIVSTKQLIVNTCVVVISILAWTIAWRYYKIG